MRYHSAKIDVNQPEIVALLRKLGAGVFLVHRLKNFCDIMVVHQGITVAVEIKDGSKPPSARKITAGEDKFSQAWMSHGGWWAKIETLDEARALIVNIQSKARELESTLENVVI